MALVDSRPAPTLPPSGGTRPRRRTPASAVLAGVGVLVVVGILLAATGIFGGGVSSQSGGPTSAGTKRFTGGGLPPCRPQTLAARVASTGSSPPQLKAALLTITNEGASSCEIFTFPELRLLDGRGKVIATAPPPEQVNVWVQIPPHSSAIANLYWQNWCGTAERPISLQVVLPNRGGTLSAPFGGPASSLPTCTDSSQASSLMATGGLDSGSLFGTGHEPSS
jgi:hypothetical protein